MELRELARRILDGGRLEDKYFFPDDPGVLADEVRGPAMPWEPPARCPELQIAPRGERLKFPSPQNLGDPEMAVRALHTFANHELMAVELMAWALVAYPETPAEFRAGMVRLLRDEQRHLRLYADRIEELGGRFGSLPMNDHFWRCAADLTTPMKWICAMNLTFEQGNLDHAPHFAEHFRTCGDEKTAELLDVIFEDEIHHVGFGVRWLKEFKDPEQSLFEAYVENLTFHNEPERARGEEYRRDARRRAGFDESFIAALADL